LGSPPSSGFSAPSAGFSLAPASEAPASEAPASEELPSGAPPSGALPSEPPSEELALGDVAAGLNEASWGTPDVSAVEPMRSAEVVAGPATPSTARPALDWKLRTAASVSGP